MNVWSESTIVQPYETDTQRQWKPANFFQRMQVAATHHAANLGFDFDEMLVVHRQVWILARQKIRFDEFPVQGEEVTIRTWPRGVHQKVFFIRDFEFSGSDGRKLAAATSAWVLMDPQARRLLPPQALKSEAKLPDNGGLVALDEPLEKIGVPDGLPERFSVQAGYSAVDMMSHVNNSRYVEWACDSLPVEQFQNGRMAWLQVNYLNEVRQGESVCLRAGENSQGWLISGDNLGTGLRAFEAAAGFI